MLEQDLRDCCDDPRAVRPDGGDTHMHGREASARVVYPAGMRRGLVLLLVLLVACWSGKTEGETITLTGDQGDITVRVDIADDPEEQARGLMGRTELQDSSGMLFVWDDIQPRRFWMKDTLIPLDLIAIRGREVVSIVTMEPCEADPCPRYPTEPADAALEVNAGWAERHGIEVGDPVSSEVLG